MKHESHITTGPIKDLNGPGQVKNVLNDSELRFYSLFENMAEGVALHEILYDEKGTPVDYVILDTNPAFTRHTGISRVDAAGRKATDLYETTTAPYIDIFEKVARTGEPYQFETYFDGLKRHFKISVFQIGSGRFSTIFEDITASKQKDNELRNLVNEWQSTFDALSNAVWLLDKDQRIIRANKATKTILGKEPDEVMGALCWEVVHGSCGPHPDCPVMRMRESLRRETMDLAVENRWLQIVVEPVLNDIGDLKGIIHIISDITERKNAEDERKILEMQLAQAQKMESIGTLAGGIAHDFNNILSAIIGYSELALDNITDPDKARGQISEVIRAGDRAKDLVKQILTFSRKTDIVYAPLALRTITKEALKMLRSVIPTSIEIRQDLKDTGLVMSDPTQINQIIMNLCTNSVHAMEETGGVLEIGLRRVKINGDRTARETDLPQGQYLMLTVKDSGHGMSLDVIERIFDPYFTTKEQGRGTGLGLSVVHGIVKSHKGAIICKSTPGIGTIFEVYLPEITSEIKKDKIVKSGPLPSGTETILFIDDEPSLVNIVKMMLGKIGYSIESSMSSIEAYNLFKENPGRFDLVITDMTMPDMTGDKLARRLMALRPDIPIILCTGYSDVISEEKAKAIGIKEYVQKPFEMSELAKTIRRVLDDKVNS